MLALLRVSAYFLVRVFFDGSVVAVHRTSAMSVVGISPTDIVGRTKAVVKAVSALSPIDEARAQYQATTQSRNDYQAAVKRLLSISGASSLPTAADLVNDLRTRTRQNPREPPPED
jgi:putative NADH-flavin reductase